MREILFRAKSVYSGEWIYGVPVSNGYITCIFNLIDGLSELKGFQVKSETVGQYTGLCDKNGVKIFEGDILKTREYGKISDYIIVDGFDTFAVIYKPCRFRLVNRNRRFNFVDIRRDQLEVIGNVHDNPELLEKKE